MQTRLQILTLFLMYSISHLKNERYTRYERYERYYNKQFLKSQ